jgi:hypothetical protein
MLAALFEFCVQSTQAQAGETWHRGHRGGYGGENAPVVRAAALWGTGVLISA